MFWETFFRWGVKVAVMFVEHSMVRLTQSISVIHFWLRFYRSTDYIRKREILNWSIRNKSNYILNIYLSSKSNKYYLLSGSDCLHNSFIIILFILSNQGDNEFKKMLSFCNSTNTNGTENRTSMCRVYQNGCLQMRY